MLHKSSIDFIVIFPSLLRADLPKPLHTLPPPATITWLAFAPNSRHLLTGGRATQAADEADYELRLWDVRIGMLAGGAVARSGIGASGAVSPNRKTAVTGGTTGKWRTWTLADPCR